MKPRPGQKEVGEKAAAGFLRAAIAAILVVAVSCTDSTGPARGIAITPAAPTVALQANPQGQVLMTTSVTLKNTSAQPIAWSSCGMSLEKAGLPALPPGKRSWDTVWQSICAALDNGPAIEATTSSSSWPGGSILLPGESVTVPVVILVGQPPNFNGEQGAYRFYFSIFTEILGTYYPVPHDLSVSDSFTLLPAS